MSGWIKLYRQILKSDIWDKPPLYLKIWVYLLLKAQHQDYKKLKQGQLITSIPEIQEAMSYMVGYRKQKPSRKQIWGAIEWLRNAHGYEIPAKGTMNGTRREPMIETMKVMQGILVNITNYKVYQDLKNYEGNDEGANEQDAKEQRRERQGNNTNKNVKNDKNKEKYSCVFEEFWKAYPRKIDKKRAFKVWNTRLKEKYTPKNMIFAAKNYAKYCKQNNTETRYIKHPSTFIGPEKSFEEFIKPMAIEKPDHAWSHLPDYTGKGKIPKDEQKPKATAEKEITPSKNNSEMVDPNLVDKLIKGTAEKKSRSFNFEEAKAKLRRQVEKIKQQEKMKKR